MFIPIYQYIKKIFHHILLLILSLISNYLFKLEELFNYFYILSNLFFNSPVPLFIYLF